MTNKDILEQYTAVLAECRILEKELSSLRDKGLEYVTDAVSGCPDYPPYGARSIQIAGIAQDPKIKRRVNQLEELLDAQRIRAIDVRIKAEKIIFNAWDATIRTALRYKYIKGMEWQEVADRMTEESDGKIYTEASIKMRCKRYLEKS